MIQNPYPGILFAFEGIDGSGKSTQRDRANNYVAAGSANHGHQVLKTKEPNKDLPSGKLIYGLLFGRHKIRFADMTQLERQRYYFVNRMEHYARIVIPALERGEIVLSDRSLVSIALDVRKPGDLDMLLDDEEEIFAMGQVPFIRPDVAIIYDLPEEIAIQRLGEKDERRRDFFEQPEKMARTRQSYLEFAKKFPEFCHVVDASGTVEEVFKQTREILHQHLELTHWR